MSFVIPFELYSTKNHKQIFINKKTGKPFVATNNKAQKNCKDLLTFLTYNRKNFLSMLEGYDKPYRLHFKIYRQTKRKFDYINIIQGVCDCLVKAGCLIDDNADELLPVFEPYEVDKKNPRLELYF